MDKIEHASDGAPAGASVQNMQRTLLIGLGGTGFDILHRIRKMVIDHPLYGDFDKIPILRFFYIDTDDGMEARATDSEKARFKAGEKHLCTVPNTDSIYKTIRDGNLPYFDWFSLDKLKNTRPGAGAGIRQIGRFALFNNFEGAPVGGSGIKDKLNAILNNLILNQHTTYMTNTYGITNFTPGISINIVASLAGGTGSGMFFDIAYIMKALLAQVVPNADNEVNAYLFLPNIFGNIGSHKVGAHGYAALKELNYYFYKGDSKSRLYPLYGNTVFDAQYGTHGTKINDDRVPFDHCYLIGNSNSIKTLTKDKILDMASKKLFLEFESAFAPALRSNRFNVKLFNDANPIDAGGCCQTFMSLGLSSLEFDIEKIKKWLSHDLALSVVMDWLSSRVEVSGPTEKKFKTSQVTRHGLKIGKEKSRKGGADWDLLDELPEEVKNDVKLYINNNLIPQVNLEKKNIFQFIGADKSGKSICNYAREYPEKIAQEMTKWTIDGFISRLENTKNSLEGLYSDRPASNPNVWGHKMKVMYTNNLRQFKDYKEKLESEISSIITDRGPDWTKGIIYYLQKGLAGYRDNFRKCSRNPDLIAKMIANLFINKNWGENKGVGVTLSGMIEEKITIYKKRIKEIKDSPIILWKRKKLEIAGKELLTWVSFKCIARAIERQYLLSAKICDNLIELLDNLFEEVKQTNACLQNLRKKLDEETERQRAEIQTLKVCSINLADKETLDQIRDIVRTDNELANFNTIASAALEDRDVLSLSPEEIEDLLVGLVNEAERAVQVLDENVGPAADTNFSAHDYFVRGFPNDGDRQTQLLNVLGMSEPYLNLRQMPSDGKWDRANLYKSSVIGIYGGHQPGDPERAKVISDIVAVDSTINPANDVQSLSEKNQILFCKEIGGFPLRALSSVDKMRTEYEDVRDRESQPLHIVNDEMAEKYPDLLCPTDDELNDAYKATELGIALGVIMPVEKEAFEKGKNIKKNFYAHVYYAEEVLEDMEVILGECDPQVVANHLAFDQKLRDTVIKDINGRAKKSDAETKKKMLDTLVNHRKSVLNAVGDNKQNVKYKRTSKFVADFIREHKLNPKTEALVK